MDKTALNRHWHLEAITDTIKILQTNSQAGLKTFEVEHRQNQFGLNKLPTKKSTSNLVLFLKQFNNPLVYILLVAGLVMLVVGDWTDTIVILITVLINAGFGFWQEHKALNILDKLKNILKTKAVVIRDGQKQEIFQEELIPGDLVVLKPGDKIPADGRIFNVNNLKISEAVLTGEWMAATKQTAKITAKKTALAERDNMAYAGSLVEGGTGQMIVTATGVFTEAGKIAQMISQTQEEESPLQKKLKHFTKHIGIIIGLICMVIFVGGFLRGGDIFEMFEASVAMAVGGIPGALPIVMTIVLAIGMDKLLRKKGLIRKLSSVEILGSTSVICFDKTKTLTKGEMKLAQVVSGDENLLFKIATLCSDAFVENPKASIRKWRVKGSPTDKAMFMAGEKKGILKPLLAKKAVEISRLPFDSRYKFQACLIKEKKQVHLYVVGAPEKLVKKARRKGNWAKDIHTLADQGLRVVGVAYKKMPAGTTQIEMDDIKKLDFVGLISFEDTLRSGIKNAIMTATKAGLKTIIITGDFRRTAKAVAASVGIKVKDGELIEGQELEEMSDADLLKNVEKIKIYARAETKHKIRIVAAWQAKNHIVAMVGDGVNDSPALKKSDIGIALGSGTEVAKASADLVLLNDSFSIIVRAIRQGRVILDNLRKSIAFTLADSFTSMILIGVTQVIFGWPLPILPVQILWNNIIEDTLPSIAYAFEPAEPGVMQRGPSPVKTPLLTHEMKTLIFITSLVVQFLTLIMFWYLWHEQGMDLDYVRTLVFGTISIDTAFVIFSYKNLRKNIWQIKLFSNKWLNISALLVFVTFAAAIYLPFLQKILHTVPLTLGSWVFLILLALLSVAMIELTKWIFIVRAETEE